MPLVVYFGGVGLKSYIKAYDHWIAFGLIDTLILISCLIIGVITTIMSAIGIYVGCRGGAWMESKAEILGGVVLVGIGIKILVEYTL